MQGKRDTKGARSISVGVERVLYTAALDGEFLEALLGDPKAATQARGFQLSSSELAVLRGVPADQLRATVAGMDISPASLERRAFLGAVAAGAAVSVAGCGDETVKGIRPDAWPDAWPDADDPTRGIRPDAAPDAGPADAAEPSDLASFGIRPGD